VKEAGVSEDGTPIGTPIAYSALQPGVPVVSRSGHRIGTVKQVLDEPEEDIFHGLVVGTSDGNRFIARDQVERITTTQVSCSVTDEEAAALPMASTRPRDDGAGAGPRWLRRFPAGRRH
jgi:hypothetical protein